MKSINDWYWTYGVQRGNDPGDPDRALRKISVGDWFDPVARSADRIETLRRSLEAKSTVALWGPSQTGKSTLLSRYLDGDTPDGSNSALTWNPETPVRFSPDPELGSSMAAIYPNTVIFNPYHYGSDASGVATRYTLVSGENPPNKDFPIEFRATSRVQVLHAIALGYLKECSSETVEIVSFRQEEFISRLREESAGNAGSPKPAAYEWLHDIANVIERLQTELRFTNLFRMGDRGRKFRAALVSAPHLLADENAARRMGFELLWDSSSKLTEFFDRIESLRTRLQSEWAGASKILLSPRVAALILDIDTLKGLFGNETEPPDQKTIETLGHVSWRWDSTTQSVLVDLDNSSSGSIISGESFGLFQALCSEIVVPVKREALEQPTKEPLLSLLQSNDLLDFPGLGRKNTGTDSQTESVTKPKPEALTDFDFYKRVLKEGRTQGIIHGHVDCYSIDSFVVLSSAWDEEPAKSDILGTGICSWLQSFDWNLGIPAPLPVFLDLTFFAKAIDDVANNGIKPDFIKFATKITDSLVFARRGTCCRWFVTTYPKFEKKGKIPDTALNRRESIVGEISGCTPFMEVTGLTREDIDAVFGEDGGTDRMLREIAAAIRPETRRARCKDLLMKEWTKLAEALARQLPSTEEAGLDARRASLRESAAKIREAVARIEDGNPLLDYAGLAQFLRDLFTAPRDIFDPVPRNAKDGKDADNWLKAQVKHWFDDAEKRVADHPVLDGPHQRELLCTLRDNVRLDRKEGGLGEFLRLNLGRITDHDTADAARFPFAVAFGNMLRGGTWRRISTTRPGEADPIYLRKLLKGLVDESNERDCSPHWKTVIEPLLARIDDLAENAKAGARPPQPGDSELRTILDNLAARI